MLSDTEKALEIAVKALKQVKKGAIVCFSILLLWVLSSVFQLGDKERKKLTRQVIDFKRFFTCSSIYVISIKVHKSNDVTNT
jgi:hypothetical protein